MFPGPLKPSPSILRCKKSPLKAFPLMLVRGFYKSKDSVPVNTRVAFFNQFSVRDLRVSLKFSYNQPLSLRRESY